MIHNLKIFAGTHGMFAGMQPKRNELITNPTSIQETGFAILIHQQTRHPGLRIICIGSDHRPFFSV
jgi:hypothetical protein